MKEVKDLKEQVMKAKIEMQQRILRMDELIALVEKNEDYEKLIYAMKNLHWLAFDY